jgi:hypothetical protein
MIETDKWLHFIVSFLIAQVSPLAAFCAGIGKEVYDALSGGFADPLDLAADAWGIVLGVLF